MAAPDEIEAEVVYPLPTEQVLVRVRVPAGATIGVAIAASGITQRYAQLNEAPLRVGVFGKRAALTTRLQAGDRVEIYRPLLVDPKETRRRRVKTTNTKNSIKSST